jgi:hypothetical protein
MTYAPSCLHSKVESWFMATTIVTMFLGSVERRFSVPAMRIAAVARGLDAGERGGSLIQPGIRPASDECGRASL